MRSEIAEVFFAQSAQRVNEWLRLSHCRTRKRVRLVLETVRPGVNERRNPETYRPRQQRKQQDRRDDVGGGKACLMLEPKGAIKPLLTRQPRDRRERHKDAGDGNAEQLQYVAFFVMANFMRENGFQFGFGELRYECVEQDDFSKTSEAGEEGVRVARAFAAIHHLDAARGKIGALRECKKALAQRPFRQRCELVEEWHDDSRRDEQEEQLKRDDNRRRPKPPVCARPLDQF